jgi:hypothetical protein
MTVEVVRVQEAEDTPSFSDYSSQLIRDFFFRGQRRNLIHHQPFVLPGVCYKSLISTNM